MQMNESTWIRLWAFGAVLAAIAATWLVVSLNSFEISIAYLALLAGVIAIGLLTNLWGGLAASTIAVFAILLIDQYASIYPNNRAIFNIASEMAAFMLVGPLAGGLAQSVERLRNQAAHWLALAEQRAAHDELLGALRPQWSRVRLEEETLRAGQFSRPLSLACLQMLPGPQAAAGRAERLAVLQALVRIVRAATRPPAVVAHGGGDQVLLIMPEYTLEEARNLAAMIRALTDSERYFPPASPKSENGAGLGRPISEWGQIQIGVSSWQPGSDVDNLIAQARADLHV